jgi:hypothetical protein
MRGGQHPDGHPLDCLGSCSELIPSRLPLDYIPRLRLEFLENNAPVLLTLRLLAIFGETGLFGGLATCSCPPEGRENRAVTEGQFLHSPW